jgi:hypothetical protein
VSTPDDKPKVTWKTIARVADAANAADAAEVDALANLSDDALDAQLDAAGFAPDDAAKLALAALATPATPAAPRGPVVVKGGVDRPRAPPRPSLWPAFAIVAAAGLLVVLLWKRAEVVALLSPAPAPIVPDRAGEQAPPRGPTPAELAQARALRAEAIGDCNDQFWAACEDRLDRARKLDPAGETSPDVQAARKSLGEAKRAPAMPSDGKPK